MRMRSALPGLNRRRFPAASAAGLGAASLTVTGGSRGRWRGWRRWAGLLVATVSIALVTAACGGASSPPAGGPGQQQQSSVGQGGQGGQGGSENSPATALRWAQCMRAHGMPNFPNPDSNGTFNFGINSGVNQQSAAYQSGAQACRSIMPPPPGP